MKKILGILVGMLLLVPVLSVSATMNQSLPAINTQSLSSEEKTILMVVFGLFPQVSGNNITFMILPFLWYTIQKDKFQGHIGRIIIYGFYNPSPYL